VLQHGTARKHLKKRVAYEPVKIANRKVRHCIRCLRKLVLCAVLAGCNGWSEVRAAGDDRAPGLQGVATQFKESDGWTVAQPQDATLRGKWWEIYNEPDLNALEDQLNIDNQNIREAFEKLHGSAGAGARGASAVFSHGERGAWVYAGAELLGLGSGADRTSEGGKVADIFSCLGGSFVGARSVGKDSQHRSCEPI
jgi:hypothetical protein